MRREGLLVPWLLNGDLLPSVLLQAFEHWPYIEKLVRRPVSEADYDGMLLLLQEIRALTWEQGEHPLASLQIHLEHLLENYDREFRLLRH